MQALHKCGGSHVRNRCIQVIINSTRRCKPRELRACGLTVQTNKVSEQFAHLHRAHADATLRLYTFAKKYAQS